MGLLKTLRFITSHPLTRSNKLAALRRYVGWQLGSRMVPGPVFAPFVNGTHLLVASGMRGATGNVYCGLHEFDDMGLVLHTLRAGDLFVDVGANVGTYVVLGASTGANVIAFEPIASTYGHLVDNICVNDFGDRVVPHHMGVGAVPGTQHFTADLDALNHVLSKDEQATDAVAVPTTSLDVILEGAAPAVIKIDVEGFETEVVRGAEKTLAHPDLLAVVIEMNGNGDRYGYDEAVLHETILAKGFLPYRYAPLDRRLFRIEGTNLQKGNIIYSRAEERLQERVTNSHGFQVLGQKI